MTLPPRDSLERLTHADLIGEATRMRAQNEKLGGALAKLRVEHQAVTDELARPKALPPRPKIKPSGMNKSTQAKGPVAGDDKGGRSSRRRGSRLDRLKIGAAVVAKADPPAGSRNKGLENIVVQDLSLNPRATRCRRERWETPDGKTIIADPDPGIVGGYGPNLHRLVLTLHFSRQVAYERIVALLNDMGVVISKRQAARLLPTKLETFLAEDEAVLKDYKLAPSAEQAQLLRARFDRIFKCASTGCVTLDSCSDGCFKTRTGSCAFSKARNSVQRQRFRKRHPRLRRQKKNFRRNCRRKRPRRATSCRGGPKPA